MDRLLEATARAERDHFWFRGFRAFARPLIARALDGVHAPRLLDCGCGTGANLDWLSYYGRAAGFDVSEVGLRIGRQAGRTRLARGMVSAAPFRSNTFDLVASFDVLYSLEERDEAAAVVEMFRLLRPGGCAIVNVAAMKALTGDHSVLSREVRRYDRPRLRRVLEEAGFTILLLTYTNATLVPVMLLVRGLHRLRGLSAEAHAEMEITVPPLPVNLMLTAVLRLEALIARVTRLPFGSSLLCLARKPPT